MMSKTQMAHRRALHVVMSGELWGVAVGAQLVIKLVRARLDGHPRAMEALREQHALPAQAVVCAGKLQLRTKRCLEEKVIALCWAAHYGVKAIQCM